MSTRPLSGISVGRTTSKVEMRSLATSSRRVVVERVDLADLAARDVRAGLRHGRAPLRVRGGGRRSTSTWRVYAAHVEDVVELDASGRPTSGSARTSSLEVDAPRPRRASRRAARGGTPSSRARPALDEREQQALREVEAVARVEVAPHALREDDEPVDEPGEAVEHVVEREERVGDDDALGRGVGDVALVPERHVLEADDRGAADDAREAADALGDDRVPLVRHRRGALLALAERLLDLAHLGAREVADLERELVERRRASRRARSERSACRSRWRICVDAGAGSSPRRSQATRSTSGSIAAYVPTAPESLPTRIPSSARATRVRDRARARRPRRRASARTSSARRGRRACGRCRASAGAPPRARRPRRARARAPARISAPASLDLQRERGVDDVRRGEAVVEPASLRAELLRDGVDEGGRVVVEASPRSRATRAGVGRRGAPRSRRRRPPAPRRPRPSRRAPRARRRASARACPRPTRSWPWPVASSARSLPPF